MACLLLANRNSVMSRGYAEAHSFGVLFSCSSTSLSLGEVQYYPFSVNAKMSAKGLAVLHFSEDVPSYI